MRFGILPPYRTGVTADPEWMVAFARHAEDVGIESLYVVEHAAVAANYETDYPYAESGRMPLAEDCPIPDPLELLAYLAGQTSRLVLATGILVLPLHTPVVLAKRLATLDVLSGGRVRLGIGVGWQREELEASGVAFETRGRRTDELIRAMRALWVGETGAFEGEFFSFPELFLRPQPVQPGGVPIHVGGHSRAAARRAGALGDGFFPLGLSDDDLVDRVAVLRDAAEGAGRDPSAVELSLGGLLTACDAAAVEAAAAKGASRLILSTTTGDLDEVKSQLDDLATRLDLS